MSYAFQYLEGAIRGRGSLDLWRHTWWTFNTSKVRLEAGQALWARYDEHAFNTSKVRLERGLQLARLCL